MAIPKTTCPNCGAIWGFEEIDCEQCSACGYPDNDQPGQDEPSEPDLMGPDKHELAERMARIQRELK